MSPAYRVSWLSTSTRPCGSRRSDREGAGPTMPQLRWTLLILGLLFIGLLVWIERRRQHRGFLDQGPVEHDAGGGGTDNSAQPVFREPTSNLPEMRARDPITPHELPVVEIEEDSLTTRRGELQPPAAN